MKKLFLASLLTLTTLMTSTSVFAREDDRIQNHSNRPIYVRLYAPNQSEPTSQFCMTERPLETLNAVEAGTYKIVIEVKEGTRGDDCSGKTLRELSTEYDTNVPTVRFATCFKFETEDSFSSLTAKRC